MTLKEEDKTWEERQAEMENLITKWQAMGRDENFLQRADDLKQELTPDPLVLKTRNTI